MDQEDKLFKHRLENLLKADLDAGQPMEYAGYDATSGHAWVCDGYQGTNYFHFNWGWGGSSNGYYYLNNLNPGGYTFNTDQQAVIHIVPSSAYYPEGCTGQTNLTTYNYGTIEDGSGPVADYSNNVSCSWLIAPDDSIMKVTLTFIRLDTDPADVITVYDGSTTGAPILGTYSGTTLPGAIMSTGPQMLVTFTSNASGSGNGFLAQYTTQPVAFCGSNTTITDPQGDIIDGSGRFNYRNSSTCKWKILPENSVAVTLVINQINTEPENDYIEVYDYLTSQKLATYSGTTIPPPVTSGAKMLVIFKSNTTIRGEGFSASYTTVVGVEDKAGVKELTVFPNPTDGFVNIDFTMKEQGNVMLEVLNISGATVYKTDLGTKKGEVVAKVDLTSQSSGVYVLRIHTDSGVVNRKVVKQ